jgi:hypothetical protein
MPVMTDEEAEALDEHLTRMRLSQNFSFWESNLNIV